MQYFYKKIAIVTFLLLMYNIEKSSHMRGKDEGEY